MIIFIVCGSKLLSNLTVPLARHDKNIIVRIQKVADGKRAEGTATMTDNNNNGIIKLGCFVAHGITDGWNRQLLPK